MIETVSQTFEWRLPVTLKGGDVIEVQEDTGATIEVHTERKRQTISQTINDRPVDDRFDNFPPSNDN